MLQIFEEPVIIVDKVNIDLDAFFYAVIFEPFRDSGPVVLPAEIFDDGRQVVLRVGVFDMGQEFCPFSHEMIPSAHEVSSGPHFRRIDVGHGDHASSKQRCNFMRIDPVILGFASVDGFHVEGVSQDEGDIFFCTEISDPIPGEHAFHGDDDIFSIGRNDFEEPFLLCRQVPVNEDVSILIQDTDVHSSCMQIDSTVILVLFGVKSHEASSF